MSFERGILYEHDAGLDLEPRAVSNADDLVAQLVAIDGPCECESAFCDHWQAEAGIILTAALRDARGN